MSSKRWAQPAVLFLTSCVIASGVTFTGFTIVDRVQSNCHQINSLKGLVVKELEQGYVSLGHRGSPGYAYYHAHPGELAAARIQLKQEIQNFAPHGCS